MPQKEHVSCAWHSWMLFCWRTGGRNLPEIIRLRWGTLLRSSLLVQNLQARRERRPGLHQAQEERHPWLRNIPALRLWGWSVLQNAKRRRRQVITESAHLPETLNEHLRNFLSRAQKQTWAVEGNRTWNGILCFSTGFLHFLVSTLQSRYNCFSTELKYCSKLLYYTVNNIRQLALNSDIFVNPVLKEGASVFY